MIKTKDLVEVIHFGLIFCEIITSLIFMAALMRFAPIIPNGLGGMIGGCAAIILNTMATLFGTCCSLNKFGLLSVGISIAAYLLCVFW